MSFEREGAVCMSAERKLVAMPIAAAGCMLRIGPGEELIANAGMDSFNAAIRGGGVQRAISADGRRVGRRSVVGRLCSAQVGTPCTPSRPNRRATSSSPSRASSTGGRCATGRTWTLSQAGCQARGQFARSALQATHPRLGPPLVSDEPCWPHVPSGLIRRRPLHRRRARAPGHS
jgi:hypothetical protein